MINIQIYAKRVVGYYQNKSRILLKNNWVGKSDIMSEDWRDILGQKKEKNDGNYHEKNVLNDLTGKEWIQLTKSVWMQKGLGNKHPHAKIEKMHPAPFSYQDVGKLISFFTKKNQIVLDPFSGVASTSKACAILKRKSVGIELTKKWVELSKERLKNEVGTSKNQEILQGDSREELNKFDESYFDFIVTSPPYWQILNKKTDLKTRTRVENGLDKKYSDDENDLGNIKSYDDFLIELQKVFSNCFRVLKDKKYMCIIVSDFRNNSRFTAYHSDVTRIMGDIGFHLKGISILVQNHKSLHPYGYPYAFVPNIHHQYILIFQKVN